MALRNRRKYLLPAHISKRFEGSPALNLVRNINNILLDITKFESFPSYKDSQKATLFKIKNSTPTTHLKFPVLNSKFLNRMRVGLILKAHLFSHNFTNVDSPACPCGHRSQDAKHFFLDCALLNNNRNHLLRLLGTLEVDILFNNLNKNEKVNFLLYGNPAISVINNDRIISSTSCYIVNSKHVFLYRDWSYIITSNLTDSMIKFACVVLLLSNWFQISLFYSIVYILLLQNFEFCLKDTIIWFPICTPGK